MPDVAYRIPKNLNDFQRKLYLNLIDYKINYLGFSDSGSYQGKDYDVILPKEEKDKNLLTNIRTASRDYISENGIREHMHFSHLASSQAACFNLFMPLKMDKQLADTVFADFLPEYKSLIDIEFEYYDKNTDHLNEGRNTQSTTNIGTDSDVAVFYLATNGEKRLFLIEHKLSEDHFTNCNAVKSTKNYKSEKCKSFGNIWRNPENCYYKFGKHYKYWELTKESGGVYDLNKLSSMTGHCPFQFSLQQLWRNQLLASAIEQDQDNDIDRCYFGVIYHGDNHFLWRSRSIYGYVRADQAYRDLLSDQGKFHVFTLQEFVKKIESSSKSIAWLEEYKTKYMIGFERNSTVSNSGDKKAGLMKYYVESALAADLEKELDKAKSAGMLLSSIVIYSYIEKLEATAGKYKMDRKKVKDVAVMIMQLLGKNGYNVEAASIAKKFSL